MHAAGGKRRSGWWSTSEDKEFGKSQLSVRLHVENLSSSCLAHKNGVKHRILPGEGEGNQGGVRASGNEWLRGGGDPDYGLRNTEYGVGTTDYGPGPKTNTSQKRRDDDAPWLRLKDKARNNKLYFP